MADLLRHLEAAGFESAPRYLGVDHRGRDIFSYLAGTVPTKWQRWSDVQVATAGRLLRSFHDATRGAAIAGTQETVCHHDAGPNNVVFRDALPVALIDFDFAAPGEALDDLGYSAWAWCVSSKFDRLPAEGQAAQLRVLVDAYGLTAATRAGFVDAIIGRQERNIGFWTDRLSKATACVDTRAYALKVIEWSERERAFTAAQRSVFNSALC